jgi:diguanylate cyclase (GGDEF)-like protein
VSGAPRGDGAGQMTLGRQLLLGISLLFALMLCGIEYIHVANTRDFLQNQLRTHAQDTATSLALSLGPAAASGDELLEKTVVNPVFDRGYFSSIEYRSVTGEVRVRQSLTPGASGVPDWFVHAFAIESPTGEALVSAGWRQLGRVLVTMHPEFAYQHLWSTTLASLGWLALLYLLALAGAAVFVTGILQPLRAVERVAEEIAERRFPVLDIHPRARELQRVVDAINLLSGKMHAAIDEEVARAERMRRDAFLDPLTGMYNRRGLEQRATALLQSQAELQSGMLAIIQLDGLNDYNGKHGFRLADELIAEAAEVIRAESEARRYIYARPGGSAFVVLEVNADPAEARAVMDGICAALHALLLRRGAHPMLSVSCGAARFDDADVTLPALMAAADEALARARVRGSGSTDAGEVHAGDPTRIGSVQWRRAIEDALAQDRVALSSQPAFRLPGREVLHHELTVRLLGADGKSLPAAQFFPMAIRHNLGPAIDLKVLELVIKRLLTGADGRYSVNVCGQSIRDAGFGLKARALLAASPAVARRIVFETTEFSLIEAPEAVQAFSALVRGLGAGFALDNMLIRGEALKRLEVLLPDYVKIAPGNTADLASSAEARFLVASLVRIANPLDVRVIANNVEDLALVDTLERLGVGGYQGYASGAPAPW